MDIISLISPLTEKKLGSKIITWIMMQITAFYINLLKGTIGAALQSI